MSIVPVQSAGCWDMPHWAWRLFRKRRYKVPHGGRGSSKSWTVARALIMLAHQPSLLFDKTSLRILCARELQNSISESVHHLLKTQIEKMGLSAWFDIKNTSITHKLNGSEFIFSGIQKNVTKIKSMEDLDIVWVEEAEKVSNMSWEVLIPTMRTPGSEIWITFNPNEDTDPTYERFVVKPPPECDSFEVNYRDNPWFPDELRKEMDYMYSTDAEAAEHVYGGKTNQRSNAVIFRGKYSVRDFIPVSGHDFDEFNWLGPYYGADWGYAADPCTLMKLWISPPKEKDKRLYIEKESWAQNLELDDIADRWRRDIPECVEGVIRADSARPDTISHVAGKGLHVIGAEKGPGSVEDGIAFLKSFVEIVIHTRCHYQIDEARLYKFKVDPITGDILKVIVDKHNHCWDADRYALEPCIGGNRSIYGVL